MSGRPDHAAARWADEADGGVDEAGPAPVTGEGSPDVDAADAGAVGDGAGDAVGDGAILADVAALTAQRDEYLESLQRLKADFDNYRKRVARLQEEQAARAEADLVRKLLPVLDNLDLAWAHLGPHDGAGNEARGVVSEEARAIAQARDQLLDVLGKEGLERVDAVDVPFDPTVHDAVAQTDMSSEGVVGGMGEGAGAAEGEGAAGDDGAANGPVPHTVSVEEVLRAGYRWRGQVLRPAMVRVRG